MSYTAAVDNRQATPEQPCLDSGQISQFKVPAASNLDTPLSYEQSRRQVSSVVVAEEFLGTAPDNHKVTYVEVPVVREVVKLVPRKSIVDVEKIVPRYEVEEVEEIVEVPTLEYVDRIVNKFIVHEPGTKLIEERTKEIVKHVPKIEYRQIEKIVEVPGEEIEVPVIQRDVVEGAADQDQEVPVVIAQTIQPVLTEVYDKNEKVNIYQYNPKPKAVDVFVAKPMQSQLVVAGAVAEEHRPVTIPAAHYNTILRQMNQHLLEDDMAHLPYLVDSEYNKVTFLHPSHTPGIVHYPELDLAALEETQQMHVSQQNEYQDGKKYMQPDNQYYDYDQVYNTGGQQQSQGEYAANNESQVGQPARLSTVNPHYRAVSAYDRQNETDNQFNDQQYATDHSDASKYNTNNMRGQTMDQGDAYLTSRGLTAELDSADDNDFPAETQPSRFPYINTKSRSNFVKRLGCGC